MTDHHPNVDWPDGFDQTPADEREPYPHGFRVSRTQAFDNIVEELDRLGAVNVRVETAAPHTKKAPHRPYSDRDPDDPAVVVYFDWEGRGWAMPCDSWDNLRDNAQAIAKDIDAMRARERYGVAMSGSKLESQALPSGDDDAVVAGSQPAHELLGVAPDASNEEVERAFRERAKTAHADVGGSNEAMRELQEAREVMTR